MKDFGRLMLVLKLLIFLGKRLPTPTKNKKKSITVSKKGTKYLK